MWRRAAVVTVLVLAGCESRADQFTDCMVAHGHVEEDGGAGLRACLRRSGWTDREAKIAAYRVQARLDSVESERRSDSEAGADDGSITDSARAEWHYRSQLEAERLRFERDSARKRRRQ